MSEGNDQDTVKTRLSLRPAGRSEVGRTVDGGSVRQSFSHGRSKVVQVEVRKNRNPAPPSASGPAARPAGPQGERPAGGRPAITSPRAGGGGRQLTATELAVRQRALADNQREAAKREAERREQETILIRSAAEEARKKAEEDARLAEEARASAAHEVEHATEPAAETGSSEPARVEAPTREFRERDQRDQGFRPRPAGGAPGYTTNRGAGPRSGFGGQGAPRQDDRRQDGRPDDQRSDDRRRAGPGGGPSARPSGPGGAPRSGFGGQGARPGGFGGAGARPSGGFQGPRPGGRPGFGAPPPAPPPTETLRLRAPKPSHDDDDRVRRPGGMALPARKPQQPAAKKSTDDRRRAGRIDVQAAIEGEDEKTRSLASVRRQRERERRQAELERLRTDQVKVVREVVLPDAITVQELANRMAARSAEVIKALMKLGVMATITQTLDADTAELVVQEFGHRVRRVSEGDVELGLEGAVDEDTDMLPRPPVVTIMGHVDHGKTSLLDALRSTDVAAGEAGGITQHIGAYQVKMPGGERITFLDTPGHEAFTAMRARGASVTDVIVLVVAADDGVMPQTIEAIRHAKAANAPIIVAINKIDKADARPERVRQELLTHEIVVEELGGETQAVEVSALRKTGLDKLEEAILLQSEILDLRANPGRTGEGTVIESRLDRGRGPVATVLVQKGTLKPGVIVVAGAEWGRVRAMLDDKGRPLAEAGPSMPVEILGLTGVPGAGEPLVVVENEARAREITEFRERKQREKTVAGMTAARGTMDEMLARIAAGAQKEVAVLIKADVQGSAEAIQATVLKLAHEEVRVRVLLSAVGQITESDVQLAKASNAVVVAFNVRATAQARELAQREAVDIRYYSIIYEVADDIEQMVRGKVAPKAREKFLGYAEIRKVFDITKVGKVAGCMVTEGLVKRGAGVRLLRENVVIHQGDLTQLKRFKDDVKEVARGYECGLSFANFHDLREGDVVECYETELVAA